jgi:hypothetical protein
MPGHNFTQNHKKEGTQLSNAIKIEGRDFKAVTNSTMRHDIWVQGQIERAGLTNLSIEPHETPEDFAMRVCRQAYMSIDIFVLLGGLLMPADQDAVNWTPKMAEETGDFLGAVTSPQDKAIVQGQINASLTSFFITGLVSLTVSQKSSQKPEAKSESAKTGDA